MTLEQITKLKNLIEQNKSIKYEIIESRTKEKKIYNFHQWADAKNYHGAFLISNQDNEAYWFLLIEWKSKICYLVLYPENRSVPILEIHKTENKNEVENLIWNYIPRKQDGKNTKRLSNFKKFYFNTTAAISFPTNQKDLSDFFEEMFWLVNVKSKSESLDEIEPEGNGVFPEGKKRQRIHYTRERNKKVVELAKREFKKKNKKLFCEVCKFNFEKKYGKIGEDFIEAHHILPLSLITEQEVKTQTKDLVMVCSNCHKMIHRRRPWLTKQQLKLLLVK